jgi:hypothetical protein
MKEKEHPKGRKLILISVIVALFVLGVSIAIIASLNKGGSNKDIVPNEINTGSETKNSRQPDQNSDIDTNSNTRTSNDDIFSDASSDLNLKRGDLSSFVIYASDKAFYTIDGQGPGGVYIYKSERAWKVASENIQVISNCSDLSAVPEQYRPACWNTESKQYDYVTEQTEYMDMSKSSNYPENSKVVYFSN